VQQWRRSDFHCELHGRAAVLQGALAAGKQCLGHRVPVDRQGRCVAAQLGRRYGCGPASARASRCTWGCGQQRQLHRHASTEQTRRLGSFRSKTLAAKRPTVELTVVELADGLLGVLQPQKTCCRTARSQQSRFGDGAYRTEQFLQVTNKSTLHGSQTHSSLFVQ